MKKYLIISAAAACVLASSVLFAACQPSDYEVISDAVQNAGSASEIVKTITVTNDGEEVASLKEEYTLDGGSYTVVTTERTLNPIGAGEQFSESVTTGTVSQDEISVGSLPAESALTDIAYTGDLTMTAEVADLGAVGLTASDVQGDVTVRYVVEESQCTEITMQYSTTNGNDVVIAIIFNY